MAAAPAYFPVIVVSDAHLGLRATQDSAAQLAAFLRNTRCDTLVLNGDIVDGTRREERHVDNFPAAQKEVLDLLNQKIASGTKVYYLPGNHDTRLRELGLFGKTALGMEFRPWLELTGPDGRRTLIAHGDGYRGETKRPTPKPPKSLRLRLHDRFYTAVIGISGAVDKVAGSLLRKHFGLAARFHGRAGHAYADARAERP